MCWAPVWFDVSECDGAGLSLLVGCTIRSLSAPYLTSIFRDTFCTSGDWLEKMLNWSAESEAGSTPVSWSLAVAVACRRVASSGDTLNVVRTAVVWLSGTAPGAVDTDKSWADWATDARLWPSCDMPTSTSSAFETVPAFVLFRLFALFFGVPSSSAPLATGLFLLGPSDFRGFFADAGSFVSITGGGGGGTGLKYSYVWETVLCIGVCVYETATALLLRRKDIVRKPRQSNAGRAGHVSTGQQTRATELRAQNLTSACLVGCLLAGLRD